jgi:hypothetical protein
MIEPLRQEILSRLARLSELAPDMRFGQLIANLAFMAAGPYDETLWNLEDEQLVEAIRQLETDLSKRTDEDDPRIQQSIEFYEAKHPTQNP